MGYISNIFPWHKQLCFGSESLIWILQCRNRRAHTTRNKHLPMHFFHLCPLWMRLRLEMNLLSRCKLTVSWNFKIHTLCLPCLPSFIHGLWKQMSVCIATHIFIHWNGSTYKLGRRFPNCELGNRLLCQYSRLLFHLG